ncbi:MAG: polyisoprenyl-phosphate glycosyltransferase [Blastocatellia bacterium]|jgi:dolichol-phosphate mannosyltransferase|nr:polyisoprenyl-phosphate glycosyltransferase [Blastocatellia bacterium]
MLISVIVPCYNEEEVIRETHSRLTSLLSQLDGFDYEIVYVDDGSRDRTPEMLQQLQASDERVRLLRFSRNFGHQVALTAGLEHAAGAAVVVIDADLQDPPEVITEMVARWRDGYEVVYGVRTDRPGESSFKLWTAKIFYRLINRLSETKMPLDAGDFRLMDRKVIAALLAMPERDRFLRGMVSWVGFKQIAVLYARAPRRAGTGKYPFMKMLKFALDGVLSFSLTPLRLAIWTGFLAILMAVAGIIYAVLLRLYTTDWVRGWASLFVAVLFMGGVQLISLGIIGEYIGRIYGEVKQRPLYLLREKAGFEQEQQKQELIAGRNQE